MPTTSIRWVQYRELVHIISTVRISSVNLYTHNVVLIAVVVTVMSPFQLDCVRDIRVGIVRTARVYIVVTNNSGVGNRPVRVLAIFGQIQNLAGVVDVQFAGVVRPRSGFEHACVHFPIRGLVTQGRNMGWQDIGH